jgi:carbonic anhydrase
MKYAWNRSSWFVELVTAALIVAGCQSSRHGGSSTPAAASENGAVVAVPTMESQAAMTPKLAVARLRAGNARFAAGRPLRRDLPAEVKAAAPAQYPFAVVLSCVDSRCPMEIVLDQGIGDIFSARVAGNTLDDDILGSMEFACKISGAKLIAVIGHSHCGAVKGAIDGVKLGNLTGLLNRIEPAMSQVPARIQPRTSKNLEFVDAVAAANVRLVMQQIRERSPILRQMLEAGQIGLVGGMYDLSTGEVHFE